MPLDAPGQRVEVVFPGQGNEDKEAIPTNSFAVVDSKVLLLTKTAQIGRYVDPTSPEATEIQPNELCVGFLGGLHDLVLEGALEALERGDKVWINAETNEIVLDPAAVGVNEVQKVTVKAKKGNFTLAFDGEKTGNIAFNATAAQVREALEALPNIAPGDVAVAGGPGDEGGTKPYVVTFAGQYEDEDVPALVADKGSLEEPGEIIVAVEAAGKEGDEVLPVGVIDEVDPTRTPAVGKINCNALNAFLAA